MTAQITWAFCPNGIDAAKTALRFSVLVSPSIASLSDLGITSAQSWPQKMATMTASLTIGTTKIALTPSMLDQAVTNQYPTLWTALFGAAPPVVATPRPNFTGATILSYDSHALSQQVHQAYAGASATVAAKPVVAPSSPLATLLTQAQTTTATTAVNASAIAALRAARTFASGPVPPLRTSTGVIIHPQVVVQGAASTYNQTFVYTTMFHNRNNMRGVTSVPPATAPASPDFHDVLAQLADQPEVLRALGMILDYEVPLSAIPSSLFAAPPTAVAISFQPASSIAGAQSTPATLCVLETTAFYATTTTPATSTVDQGLLAIEQAQFMVEQLDLDHAANTLATAAVDVSGAAETSVPALRSHGFSLLHSGRDAYVQGRIVNAYSVAQTTGAAATLHSDDIVRGYRVDVSTDGAHWTSLCKRAGTVTIGTGTSAVKVTLPTPSTPSTDYPSARDEGYVKASAPTAPADAPALLHVHEALFGWNGWSLVARHPAQAVGFNGTQTTLGASSNQSLAASPFQVAQAVVPQRGSLPKLRYGTSYQFRARVVDLAGNSLPLSAAGAPTTHVTAPQTFARYEPVVTPTLVPRKRITEGEANERLVIRSSGASGVTAAAFASTINAATGGTSYFATCDRHAAPPKVAQTTAERHGMFDAPMAQKTNAAFDSAYALASKDGSFFDKQTGWMFVPGSGAAALASLPASMVDPTTLAANGGAPPPGAYVYIDANTVTLPYLPDPLAAGVRVASSAEMASVQPSLSATKAFTGAPAAWPNVTPFRIVLQDSNGAAPSINASSADGDIDVFLPAGTMLWLDYSSTIAAGPVGTAASGAQTLGWYQELVTTSSDATVHAAVSLAIASGTHWMFTPKRQLQLVHATLKPVQAPTLTGFTATRSSANATYATLTGTIGAHSQSTAHVDLLAQWNDWDDGAGAWVPRSAKVAMTQFSYGDAPKAIANVRQEFADTKARQVSYTPVATTRYREYFPTSMTANSSAITLAGTPVAPNAATATQLPGVIIPSSRTPPPPRVLYVVPAIKRTTGTGTSTRDGSALRVYIDRPWFDSGFGEKLAVLCSPAAPPQANLGAPMTEISRIGRDPLFDEAYSDHYGYWGMTASQINIDASGRMRLISNYPLPDGTYTDLVVFDVDRTDVKTDGRGLFFVDIELPKDAFSFASFALARYQPNAIAGAQLSRRVWSDYTRISANRSASISSTTTGANISVTGPSASLTPPPQITYTNPPVTTGGGGGTGGAGGGGAGSGGVKQDIVKVASTPTEIDPTSAQYAAAGSNGRYVQATLETTTNAAPADLDDEIWRQATTVILSATSGADDGIGLVTLTWTGTLPFTRVAGTRYRVVLREFEIHATDLDSEQGPFEGPWAGSPPSTMPYNDRRDVLVYSDIVPIT